ncbi:MAG: ACT domain-containing protein [Methanobacteriota archaeon]|nr:MAG: ACT domain-containing protein [Euryarchaeota archaeon]
MQSSPPPPSPSWAHPDTAEKSDQPVPDHRARRGPRLSRCRSPYCPRTSPDPRAQPDGIDGGRATLVALERYPGQGSRMIQIDVDVPDRPGELAKLAAILGATGINIDAISAESAGGRSYMSLIVNQPMQAREALMKNGYSSAMRTVLVVRLDDKPGALASLARKLGDSGVDVVSLIHLGTVGGHAQIALGVDNLEKARSLV